MNGNKLFSIPFFIPAVVISIGIIIAASIGAFAFYKSRTLDNVLSVTGSAKTRVTSDSVKWNFSLYRRVTEGEMQSGYTNLAHDTNLVLNFLKQNKIDDSQITTSPVFMEEQYKDPTTPGPREIILRQQFTVQSTDVEGITALAKNINTLIRSGVLLTIQSPEYYYTKLGDLRVSLLADSIKDAKARAEQIAKSSGQAVGSLKSTSSGVVQVLPPNSVEVTDYGSYDTSSIEKDVMVTVRASFFIK